MKIILVRRIISIVLLAVLSANLLPAQNKQTTKIGNDRFSIKAQAFMGMYLCPSGNIEDIAPNAPTGLATDTASNAAVSGTISTCKTTGDHLNIATAFCGGFLLIAEDDRPSSK